MDALEALMLVREVWAYGAHAEGAAHWGGGWLRSRYGVKRIERLEQRFDRLVGPRLVQPYFLCLIA
jgi:hypothetical protein